MRMCERYQWFSASVTSRLRSHSSRVFRARSFCVHGVSCFERVFESCETTWFPVLARIRVQKYRIETTGLFFMKNSSHVRSK